MGCNFILNSQNITFTEGPELDKQVGIGKEYVIGEDASSFYILCSYPPGILAKKWVEKYNKKTLNIEYTADIGLIKSGEYFDYTYDFIKLELIDGEILVFHDVYDSKKKKKVLYQRNISKSGIVSERKEVLSVDCTPFTVSSIPLTVIISRDRSKFLVQLSVFDRKLETQPFIALYNFHSLENIWKKNTPTTYENGEIVIFTDSINEKGEICLSFFTDNEKKEQRKYKAIFSPSTGQLINTFKFPRTLKDETKDIIPSNVEYTLKNGQYVVASIYRDLQSITNPKEQKIGTCLIFYNKSTMSSTLETYAPFPDDVNTKLTYQTDYIGYKKGASPANKPLIINEIIETEDAIYVIGEHAIKTIYQISNGTSQTASTNREIIVSKFSIAGKHEWTKIIPKFSEFSGDYNMIVTNNKLFFFYLENQKNEQFNVTNYSPKDPYPAAKLKSSNTVCTTLNSDGSMSKQIILRPIKDHYYYCPSWKGLKVLDNELIVHYQFGESFTSNTKLGIITVK